MTAHPSPKRTETVTTLMQIDPHNPERVAVGPWIVVGRLVFVFAVAALSRQT
jgi:hypothetical protein